MMSPNQSKETRSQLGDTRDAYFMGENNTPNNQAFVYFSEIILYGFILYSYILYDIDIYLYVSVYVYKLIYIYIKINIYI